VLRPPLSAQCGRTTRATARYYIIITQEVLARVPTADTRQEDYRHNTLSVNEVADRSVLSLRLVHLVADDISQISLCIPLCIFYSLSATITQCRDTNPVLTLPYVSLYAFPIFIKAIVFIFYSINLFCYIFLLYFFAK